MPRPVSNNINDPLKFGYDYGSYGSMPGKHEEIHNSKRLNELDFTIDDFQKVASGKYNAGDIALTSKDKLDIVNNHRHWTIFNNTRIDATDSFTVRMSFAYALSQAGVDKDKMTAIRERLGLGDTSYTMASSKAFTPLSRQEVREIIDDNMDAINAHRDEHRQLKNDDQIHAGYSKSKRDFQIAERKALTTANNKANHIGLDSGLADIIDLFDRKNFTKFADGELEVLKDFAEELCDKIAELTDKELVDNWAHEMGGTHKVHVTGGINFHLDRYGDVVAEVDDGKKLLEFSFGMKPRDLMDKIWDTTTIIDLELDRRNERKPTPLGQIFTGSAAGLTDKLMVNFANQVKTADANADPAQVFSDRMKSSLKEYLAIEVASQLGTNPTDSNGMKQFFTDLSRGFNVKFGGVTLPIDDQDAALDIIAKFVSHDQTMTWEKASDEVKTQANILMSLCHQGTAGMSDVALNDALDTSKNSDKMSVNFGAKNDGAKISFNVAWSPSKKNVVVYIEKHIQEKMLILQNEKGDNDIHALSDKSQLNAKMRLMIPVEQLDRLGKADWSKNDTAPMTQVLGARRKSERNTAAKLIPEEFRFKPKVRIRVTADIELQEKNVNAPKDGKEKTDAAKKVEPRIVERNSVENEDVKPEGGDDDGSEASDDNDNRIEGGNIIYNDEPKVMNDSRSEFDDGDRFSDINVRDIQNEEKNADPKAAAAANLKTVVYALANHYSELNPELDVEFFTNIIKTEIPDWEYSLGKCDTTAESVPTINNINDDLRNFIGTNGNTFQNHINEYLK